MPPAAIATMCQTWQVVRTVVAEYAKVSKLPFALFNCCTKLLRDNAANAHHVQKQHNI